MKNAPLTSQITFHMFSLPDKHATDSALGKQKVGFSFQGISCTNIGLQCALLFVRNLLMIIFLRNVFLF